VVEVGTVDLRETDADKLVGDVFELFQTDNLPVIFTAVNSRHAAEDDHERFAGLGGLGLALFEGGQPTGAAALALSV
jgi:hypothetical protein